MKLKLNLHVLVFGLFLLLATASFAAASSFYVGVKGGLMMSDLDEMDDAVNGGLVLGYAFVDDEHVGSFAVEAEYTNTISKGDVSILGADGEWEVETLALYGVYRSPGTIYVKGKIGVLNEDVSIDVGGIEAAESDTGGSLGIGGGIRIGDRTSLEIEYTIIEEDVDFLSAGLNIHF